MLPVSYKYIMNFVAVSMEMWFDRCAWLCVLIKVRYEPVLARGCTGQFVLPDLVDVDLDPCYNKEIQCFETYANIY